MTFHKYHGTGNDFIIIDNRELLFPKNNVEYIAKLCHRRYGVGADGLILLEKHNTLDFKMVYFNADGKEGSMCGNGGRCIVAFAKKIGVIEYQTKFEAVDGLHEASIDDDNIVSLKMSDVHTVQEINQNSFFLDTGSPHYIYIVKKMPKDDFVEQAKTIRFSKQYKDEGVNVNFIEEKTIDSISIRTYERGVEDETYSCGTGAVAAAIVMAKRNKQSIIILQTKGGDLKVSLKYQDNTFDSIYLKGKATLVFQGTC